MNPSLTASEGEPILLPAPSQPWYQRPMLDSASQARVYDLVQGDEAQAAFREGGEQRYLDYVNQRLRNAPNLAGLALSQGEDAGDKTVTPVAGGKSGEPGQALGIIPFGSGHGQPTGEDAVRQEGGRTLNEATLRYAGLIAMRRAGHGDALLEQQRRHRRIGRVVTRVLGAVFNPAEANDYRRAEQLARQSAEAANEYRQRVQEFIRVDAVNRDNVTTRRNLMDQFEAAVQAQALERTFPRQRPDGTRYRNWWDERQVHITEQWFNGGRVRRAAIVAPGALGAGAVIGLVVGTVSLPAVGVGAALFGTVVIGRSIGGAIASSVSRLQEAHRQTRERHNQETQARHTTFSEYLHTLSAPDLQEVDVTRVYESTTLARAQENLHRKRRAEAVGAIAAGAAFGVTSWSAANARVSSLGTHTGPAQSPPTSTTPPTRVPHVTSTPHTPPINTHAAPWTVAHQLQPGHEWNLINNAMRQYNAAHGTHLHLVPHANGTQWTWIEDGSRALNSTYQNTFNQFMESLVKAT